jgi:hypothetical protein
MLGKVFMYQFVLTQYVLSINKLISFHCNALKIFLAFQLYNRGVPYG